MRTFLTQRLNVVEELRAQLAQIESDLVVVQKVISDGGVLLNKVEEERKAAKVEAYRIGEEKEVAEAKCKDLEQEKYQLMKELEELRAGFAAEKEALIKDYQK